MQIESFTTRLLFLSPLTHFNRVCSLYLVAAAKHCKFECKKKVISESKIYFSPFFLSLLLFNSIFFFFLPISLRFSFFFPFFLSLTLSSFDFSDSLSLNLSLLIPFLSLSLSLSHYFSVTHNHSPFIRWLRAHLRKIRIDTLQEGKPQKNKVFF